VESFVPLLVGITAHARAEHSAGDLSFFVILAHGSESAAGIDRPHANSAFFITSDDALAVGGPLDDSDAEIVLRAVGEGGGGSGTSVHGPAGYHTCE